LVVTPNQEIFAMKKVLILGFTLFVGLSTAAFGRGGSMGGVGSHMGGLGMHHSLSIGGAFGTNPTAPGTNSLGTALASDGAGRATKGPLLGTGNAAVDREDQRVDKMVGSICRGC